MAGVEDQTTLAGAEAAISIDALRRFDAIFRTGAGVFSIVVVLIAWELFAKQRQSHAVHAAAVFGGRDADLCRRHQRRSCGSISG